MMGLEVFGYIEIFYSDVIAWEKSQIIKESSDSDNNSENDKVLKFEALEETLKDCSSERSSCYLSSTAESCEESNENDQNSVDAGEREVKIIKKSEVEEANKRLEMASKLLDERQITLTRFLQLLDPAGEWFPEDSKFSFEVEEENIETNTIESTKACEEVFNEDYSCYQHNMETNTIELIMKDFYGPDWSSPFHFEFNAEIKA